MPDITMCTGGDCPLKLNCYRFMAVPNEFWQSYMAPKYIFNRESCYFYEELK